MQFDKFWHVYSNETITTMKIMNIFIIPKSFFMPLDNPSLLPFLELFYTPSPKKSVIHFLLLYISLHFLEFYTNGII